MRKKERKKERERERERERENMHVMGVLRECEIVNPSNNKRITCG